VDVTEEASIEAARDRVHAATGGRGVDVLVNAAGTMALGPAAALSDAQVRAVF
jgi:NAD(P)-dependent dehydrogenase (short-subunit alcohol dehydrogenase family)